MFKPVLFLLALVVIPVARTQTTRSLAASGSVEGIVADRITGAPIFGALVELDGIVNTRVETFTATTSRDGTFTLNNIPASNYWLIASLPGNPRRYVPYVWGQRGLTGPGTQIALEPSQRIQNIRLELVPTGRISGKALDSSGQPQANKQVVLLTPTYGMGPATFADRIDGSPTNNRGEFQFEGVTPGQYYIAVNGFQMNLALPQINTDYTDLKFETTYYPGVTAPSKAAYVDLKAGSSVGGLDISLHKFTFRKIHGTVIDDATGKLIKNASVLIIPVDAYDSLLANSQTVTNGTFAFNYVVPKTYFVFAYVKDGNPSLFGRTRFQVGEKDIDNVTVRMKPGFELRGRIALEGNPSQRIGHEQVSIVLRPKPPSNSWTLSGYIVPLFRPGGFLREVPLPGNVRHSSTPMMLSIPLTEATLEDNGAFHFQNVMPWDYTVEVESRLPDSFVKSVRFANADILKDGIHLDAQPRDVLEVVISDGAGSLSGKVLKGSFLVNDGFKVVLVPIGAGRQDLYRSAWTDKSGSYRMEHIAPGEYRVYCWDYVKENAWTDAQFLRLYETRGTPVRISGSSTQTLDVRVIPEWY